MESFLSTFFDPDKRTIVTLVARRFIRISRATILCGVFPSARGCVTKELPHG